MSYPTDVDRTIQLGDEKGEYINTIHIPPFLNTPDIITWCKRVFYRYTSETYREAFVWNVVENGPAGTPNSPLMYAMQQEQEATAD